MPTDDLAPVDSLKLGTTLILMCSEEQTVAAMKSRFVSAALASKGMIDSTPRACGTS